MLSTHEIPKFCLLCAKRMTLKNIILCFLNMLIQRDYIYTLDISDKHCIREDDIIEMLPVPDMTRWGQI